LKRLIQFQFLILSLAVMLLGPRAAAHSRYVQDASWGTADGLPQSVVLALTQTHDGYLWLGTLNGLVRFDGNAFTPFNVNNTPDLPDNRILFLFEDSRSNLWVDTANAGLCLIHNGQVKRFDAAVGERITSAFEDQSGTVWFDSVAGNADNWLRWLNGTLAAHAPDVPQEMLLRSKHLLLTGQGEIRWELKKGRVLRFQGDRLEQSLSTTNLWPSSMVPWGPLGALNIDREVTAAVEDPGGNLVVGTLDSGVYWFDGVDSWRHIAFGNPLQDSILALCFDREGNLWVGTDGGGIYRVTKAYFDTPAGLDKGVAKSVAEDAAGGLWVAFNAQGLTYALTNELRYYPIGRGSNAWSVLVDQQQRVWAGTSTEGLFRFSSGSFAPVPETVPIGPHIYALFQDREARVWVGGDNGLARCDRSGWKIFAAAAGLPPHAAVQALAEDAAGNLWIGTDAGLYRLSGGRISPVAAPIQDISALLAGADEVLWAGSSGHGLARLAQGQWTSYAATNGLPGDDIGYLIEAGENLWIGSYEGLIRADKKSLADFAANPGKKISCRIFLTTECSEGAQPAALRTRDGRLLFPTIQGVVAVNPADLKRDRNPPPVVIESVLVDGAPQKNHPLSSTWPEAIVLHPGNEQLEIHFTALNFSAPKGVQFGTQFKYRLAGDKNWTDVGGERVAHFGRLAPGRYRFHVQAGNEDGYWNETGATIAILVEPPFWRKPWFLAAGILTLLGALAGTIYLVSTAKLKRQLRLAQQKEAIEQERARIARDLHDQLGANLTQITLLGEMAEADKDLPGEIEQHSQQICVTARETTRSLDEIVWAVNPSNDTLESLVNYACQYAQNYFAMAGISYRSELPPGLPPIPILPEVRHNVFLAYKEAVNNVVKHARATEARVKLVLEPGRFILSITDNGRGLGDVSGKQLRNGLKNMRRRLADVHGRFDLAPGPGGGTVVRLTVPVKP